VGKVESLPSGYFVSTWSAVFTFSLYAALTQ
jgi:hypothetical protein